MSSIVYIAELGVDNAITGRVLVVEAGHFQDSDDAIEWARAQMGKPARDVLNAASTPDGPKHIESMSGPGYFGHTLVGFSIAAYDKVEGETLDYVHEEDAE